MGIKETNSLTLSIRSRERARLRVAAHENDISEWEGYLQASGKVYLWFIYECTGSVVSTNVRAGSSTNVRAGLSTNVRAGLPTNVRAGLSTNVRVYEKPETGRDTNCRAPTCQADRSRFFQS